MSLPTPSLRDADRAFDIFVRLLKKAGTGIHCLTLAIHTGGESEIQQLIYSQSDKTGIETDGRAALDFCCFLAAAVTGRADNAGLIMRSVRHPDESVCGWVFDNDGDPIPLTAAAVFDAYCTDYATGQLIPPQPGVHHRDAPVIHI
ncbi:hypothetical protein [Streptomyces genisteinicus]|uniref:Uncharacterized protein n=1 Tax=Streptomyces genisteinicus TaxID=2768068 RepID=A0A7H0I587_9ACTN|nr:hypothetical protein [Streptomyces genisteinicus]QNP67953.1 hypothetical protein IAG43_33855 [Streptomyces genisteinicus]